MNIVPGIGFIKKYAGGGGMGSVIPWFSQDFRIKFNPFQPNKLYYHYG